MLSLVTSSLSFGPARLGGPYPQDCTRMDGAVVPHWYNECTKAPGGCFSISTPKEDDYNIGNTTMGQFSGDGAQWCVDHLQGKVYTKIDETRGAQYYEVDKRGASQGGACRFLVGFNGSAYEARVYVTQGLNCTLANTTSHNDQAKVRPARPPRAPGPHRDAAPTRVSCSVAPQKITEYTLAVS